MYWSNLFYILSTYGSTSSNPVSRIVSYKGGGNPICRLDASVVAEILYRTLGLCVSGRLDALQDSMCE